MVDRSKSRASAENTGADAAPAEEESRRAGESVGEFRIGEDIGTALIDGLTFMSRAVQYAVIDGMAIVEGDINLGAVERVREQTELRRRAMNGEPIASSIVISGSQFRWANATIPYAIAADLVNPARVHDAIAHWHANTPFRFVLRDAADAAHADWVEFVPGNGCSSFVGRQGGRQTVTLGDGCSAGNCIHEIGHVIGLWHEQSREDRDAFVAIQWANIIPAAINNFAQHVNDGDDVGGYDYGSIMHYPRNAFSRNGQDTIVPVNADAVIGQRVELSPGDISASQAISGIHPPTPRPMPTFPTLPRPTFPTIPRPTLPTLTRPTLPTLTRPTLPTFQTITRPTLTRPTLTRPTLPTFPTLTRPTFPTLTRPTLTRPTLPTFPTQTRPTFPTLTRPTFPTQTRPTFPTQTRPTFPTLTRPTLTRPTLPTFPTQTRPTFPTQTRPTFPTQTRPTFPTLTRPTLTRPTLTRPPLTLTRQTLLTRPPFTVVPFTRVPFTRVPFTRVPFTRVPFTRVPFTRPPGTIVGPRPGPFGDASAYAADYDAGMYGAYGADQYAYDPSAYAEYGYDPSAYNPYAGSYEDGGWSGYAEPETNDAYGYGAGGYDGSGYAEPNDASASAYAGYEGTDPNDPYGYGAGYDAGGYDTGYYIDPNDPYGHQAAGYDTAGYEMSGYDTSGYDMSGYDASGYADPNDPYGYAAGDAAYDDPYAAAQAYYDPSYDASQGLGMSGYDPYGDISAYGPGDDPSAQPGAGGMDDGSGNA